ncbi:MAG: hypothetical protein V1922_01205 [bacterium]
MLTKEDLQAIEGIFGKSFDRKFGNALDAAFDRKFGNAFDAAFDRKFDEKIKPVLKPIHKKLNKLQKDINTIVRVFDSDIIDLKKRTDKLETAVFATI